MDQIDKHGHSTVIIHFVFQTNPTRLACMPNMTEFGQTEYHPVVLHTNESHAVTCPTCKKTDTYKRAFEKHEIK